MELKIFRWFRNSCVLTVLLLCRLNDQCHHCQVVDNRDGTRSLLNRANKKLLVTFRAENQVNQTSTIIYHICSCPGLWPGSTISAFNFKPPPGSPVLDAYFPKKKNFRLLQVPHIWQGIILTFIFSVQTAAAPFNLNQWQHIRSFPDQVCPQLFSSIKPFHFKVCWRVPVRHLWQGLRLSAGPDHSRERLRAEGGAVICQANPTQYAWLTSNFRWSVWKQEARKLSLQAISNCALSEGILLLPGNPAIFENHKIISNDL